MAWQNLTPQLRTRLSRLERLVGLFVVLALLLLLLGIAYFLYQAAQRKGWFEVKAPYFTFVDNAAGLMVGDKVKLMGFDVGEITEITAMEPFAPWNVYVEFVVREPFYGYLWSDSQARVAAGDLLGNRHIEVTKGSQGLPSYLLHELREFPLDEALNWPAGHGWRFSQRIAEPGLTNLITQPYAPVTRESLNQLARLGTNAIVVFNINEPRPQLTAILDQNAGRYKPIPSDSKGFFLPPDESPALTQRMEQVVDLVERAVPNVLDLTNHLQNVLTQAAALTHRADQFVASTQPVVTNLLAITTHLRNPDGSLGQWLLPSPLRSQLDTVLDQAGQTLLSANQTMDNTQTNLQSLTDQFLLSLQNLALLTSNLNAQVQANEFILTDLSDLIRNTDDMVQGLKRHWLLKGSFSPDSNAAPVNQVPPSLAPPP